MGNSQQNFEHMTAEEIAVLCRYREICDEKNASLQKGQALLASIAQTLTKAISFHQKVDIILRLTGEALGVSRVYIFEDDYEKNITINTFEWCAEGINPEIDNLQATSMDFVADWYRIMGEQGYINASNIATLPENLRIVLEPQHVISIVVFKLQLPNGGTGFAGFDECVAEREWQRHELDILISITGIISSLYEQEDLLKQVRAKEQNFMHMFNSITDYLFVADKEGYLLQVNSAVRQKLLFNEIEAAKGRVHVLDLHPEKYHEQAALVLEDMAHGGSSRCQIPIIGKNRKEIPVETTSWYGEWDNQDVLLALSKDVSAEHDALDMFNKLFESNPLPIFVFDPASFLYTKVNQAFVDLLGYTRKELIGIEMQTLDIFLDAREHRPYFLTIGEEDQLESTQIKLRAKDGSIIEGLASGSFVNTGGLIQFMVVFTDITEQLALKAHVEDQRQRLAHIVESTDLGTWEWNFHDDKLIVNRRWAEMFGYTLEELGDTNIRTWRGLLHPEDVDFTDAALTAHIQGATPFCSTECRVRHKDGSYVWIRDTGKILEHTPDGMPKSMFGSHLDITGAKLAEQKLLEAKIRAEEENKAKSRFLAMFSHEIRTPIHTMQGITELLAKSKLSEKQKYYTLLLQQSSHIVLETINNTLDFSKIEADTIDLHPTPFFLNELSDNLQDLFSFRFAQKGLDLVTYIHPDTPLHLLGDRFRLMQIIQNLMSNAEKYTVEGSVLFTIRLLASEGPSARLEFAVTDTGVGLEASALSDLFTPYWQGSDCHSRTSFAGSGLGLPIVKNLVTMMGGSITVESQKGKGSTFKVIIPFTPLSGFTLRTQSEELAPPVYRKVYLQKTLQTEYLYRTLELLGIPVGFLTDQKSIQDGAPSVVVVDWSLFNQEEDRGRGKMIQMLEDFPSCRFVVLASVMDAEELISEACSCARFTIVTKPVSVWKLLLEMEALFKGSSWEDKDSYELPTRQFGSILVCEDHAVNREMVQELLMSVGYAVDGVSSGRAALEKLEHHEYDLLLLDLQMPGLDGFETAQIIRNDLGSTIPIIAFTAHALPEYEKKSARFGMNGYLTKPIVPAQLYQIVDTWITHGSQRITPSRDYSGSERIKIDELATHVERVYGCDLKGAMERYLNNFPVYYKHLCHTEEEMRSLIETLSDPSMDMQFLKKELHGLRGVVANLGMQDLSAFLFSYEVRLKAGLEEVLVDEVRISLGKQLLLIGEYRAFLQEHLQDDVVEPSSRVEVVASSSDALSLCSSIKRALVLGDADRSAALAQELTCPCFGQRMQQAGKTLLEHIGQYEFSAAEVLLDSLLAGS